MHKSPAPLAACCKEDAYAEKDVNGLLRFKLARNRVWCRLEHGWYPRAGVRCCQPARMEVSLSLSCSTAGAYAYSCWSSTTDTSRRLGRRTVRHRIRVPWTLSGLRAALRSDKSDKEVQEIDQRSSSILELGHHPLLL